MNLCKICKKWLSQKDGVCWICKEKNYLDSDEIKVIEKNKNEK